MVLVTPKGSPVPVASRVAAHFHFVGTDPTRNYAAPADPRGPLLQALRHALLPSAATPRPLALPPVQPPSPIWNEKNLTGGAPTKRKSSGTTALRVETSCEVQLTLRATERLTDFVDSGEERWFHQRNLATHWCSARQSENWARHQLRHQRDSDSQCRPCQHFYRRAWVLARGLPMTAWDDAGRLPAILTLSHAPLSQPVVLVPRTSGRQMTGGCLHYGPYSREDHSRQVGDLGQCIMFGQQQQQHVRTLRERGLVFLAVNMDRGSNFMQFLMHSCVLYLLGHWLYFPLFLGEGRSSFPWLGPRWTVGLTTLQQLVRQRLRELLADEGVQAPLRRIAQARRGAPPVPPSQLAAELPTLRDSCDRGSCPLPDVPQLALTIEQLQRRALALHWKRRREPPLPADAIDAALLNDTLCDRPRNAGHCVLSFPSQTLMAGQCSRTMDQGGFLAPRQVRDWMNLDMVKTNQWPEVAEAEDPRPRRAPHAPPQRTPVLHGENVVVLPNFCFYLRGLTERAGRGPRDAEAPYECNTREPAPPRQHELYEVWQLLKQCEDGRKGRQATQQARALVGLFGRAFPQPRARWRGGSREEAEEGAAAWSQSARQAEFSQHRQKHVRAWLEQHPAYFEVKTVVDTQR